MVEVRHLTKYILLKRILDLACIMLIIMNKLLRERVLN